MLLIFTLDYISNLTVGGDAPDGVWMNGVGASVKNQSCGEEISCCYQTFLHKPVTTGNSQCSQDSLCWLMSMRMEMRLV